MMHLGVFDKTLKIKGLTAGEDGVKRLVMPQVYDLDKVDWETYMDDLLNLASLFHIKDNRFDPSRFPIPFEERVEGEQEGLGRKRPAKLKDYISDAIFNYLSDNKFLTNVNKIVNLVIVSQNAGFWELTETMLVVSAIHHQGKSSKEIKESFGLSSDFTEDERKAIESQTAWEQTGVQARVPIKVTKKRREQIVKERMEIQMGSKFVPTFKK